MNEIEKIQWTGWETIRLIGRGSFGAVYEIQRTVFDDVEKAALKVISIPYNRSDIDEMYSDGYDDETITSVLKDHLKSIVAEYFLMRKMNGSANVVSCDDVQYIPHEDGPGWDVFIKMELLTPLSKSLQEKFDDQTVIEVGIGICNALELCKQYGIVHRDIKPQNIFVSPHGDYKLGDFGIAKTIEKTIGGTKIGTYKYMAPEVYNNQPYGSGADIYSLGLVLYWMMNEHRLPFCPLPPQTPTAAMDEEARRRRFTGECIPAPAHGSEELKKIILKACAFDPKDRYASATEMKRALMSINKPLGVLSSFSTITDSSTQQPANPQSPITAEKDKTIGVWSANQNALNTTAQMRFEISSERGGSKDPWDVKSSGNAKSVSIMGENHSKRVGSSTIGNKASLSFQKENFDETRSYQDNFKSKKGLVAIIVASIALVLILCLVLPQLRKDGAEDNLYSQASTVPGNTSEATTMSTSAPDIMLDFIPELNRTEVIFKTVEETVTLQVCNLPENADVIWRSLNESIVRVDANGVLTPVSSGETSIVVGINGKQSEVKVICELGTVNNSDNMHLNVTDVTVEVGEKFPLYLYNSENEFFDNITYVVDDLSVCTVEKNHVIIVGAGTTKVRVIHNDMEFVCIVRAIDTSLQSEEHTEKIQQIRAWYQDIVSNPTEIVADYTTEATVYSQNDQIVIIEEHRQLSDSEPIAEAGIEFYYHDGEPFFVFIQYHNWEYDEVRLYFSEGMLIRWQIDQNAPNDNTPNAEWEIYYDHAQSAFDFASSSLSG